MKRILDELSDRWFWFKWDLELWWKGLPICGWCFGEFLSTRDLGYLHDSLRGLWPW